MSTKRVKRAQSSPETDTNYSILTMRNGRRYEIISQDGKYYYVKNGQFRKSNPMILSVKAR